MENKILLKCLRTCVQVRGLKRLGCHADLYTVSRCHTRGESEDHTSEEARKGIHPGFENQKSKTGVSVAPRKGLMSSKIFLKRHDTDKRYSKFQEYVIAQICFIQKNLYLLNQLTNSKILCFEVEDFNITLLKMSIPHVGGYNLSVKIRT